MTDVVLPKTACRLLAMLRRHMNSVHGEQAFIFRSGYGKVSLAAIHTFLSFHRLQCSSAMLLLAAIIFGPALNIDRYLPSNRTGLARQRWTCDVDCQRASRINEPNTEEVFPNHYRGFVSSTIPSSRKSCQISPTCLPRPKNFSRRCA